MFDALAEFAVARGQFGAARVELPLEFRDVRWGSAGAASSLAVMRRLRRAIGHRPKSEYTACFP